MIGVRIKGFEICDSHACATDASGKLYTWGTGSFGELGHFHAETVNTPTLVKINNAVEVKEAKVAKGYTTFKTSGGYLYVIGKLNPPKRKSFFNLFDSESFNQVQGISNYFIRTFCCAEKYIVILTQTGEILYVDEYLRITKVFSDP